MAKKNKQGRRKVAEKKVTEPKMVWRKVAEQKIKESNTSEQVADHLSELEKGWVCIQQGITKLRNNLEGLPYQVFTSEEYIKMYTVVYNLCFIRRPEDYKGQLYDRYKESIEEYINKMVLTALRDKHDECMLRELTKRWDNHKIMLRWFQKLFHYLDRYPKESVPTLNEVGFMCFRDQVYAKMKNDIKDSVITMIDREREGEKVDRALLQKTIEMFEVMGMGLMDAYQNDFELPMLTDTAAYYSRKAASWIEEKSCPDYMLKAEECLKREEKRILHYLHASTKNNLLERVQYELLTQYENRLLEKESGFQFLLQNDKVEDLSRMYRLFCKVPNGLDPLSALFRQYIKEEGTNLVTQANHASSHMKTEKKDIKADQEQDDVVGEFLELHEKYSQQVRECFEDHHIFRKALKEAFEVFCNKSVRGSTSGQLFATFCDNLLKRAGSQGDEAVEDSLQKVERLFPYINDRDIFAEFCQKNLARRLLAGKTTNDDHERSLLAKIKQQFGWKLTSRMQGMVNDLAQAREHKTLFEDYLKAKSTCNQEIDMTMTVLDKIYWPSYNSSDLVLPPEMVKYVEVSTDYYKSKTANRKLTWMYSLGTCLINVNFDSKPVELILTHYQAAVLLLFPSNERLSYAEIKEKLNLADEDSVRLLHSLSCAKYKILKKDPSTTTITPADYFEFNAKFVNKMRRIKVPIPPLDEKRKVIQDVDKDRSYAIDASIIRTMKSQKHLPHQQLVVECLEQLGRMFKPEFKVIKKRIDDLIQREFLERDKDNFNTYKYLA